MHLFRVFKMVSKRIVHWFVWSGVYMHEKLFYNLFKDQPLERQRKGESKIELCGVQSAYMQWESIC